MIKACGKVKLCRVKILKEKNVWREQKPKPKVSVCQVCISDDSVCANGVCDISLLDEAIKNNPQLSKEQATDLNKLVTKFPGVFSDNFGQTDTISHEIHLTIDVPVHDKPRPMPHHLHKYYENEVDRMFKLGVTEPRTSPHCAPVVLVKKAENTKILC